MGLLMSQYLKQHLKLLFSSQVNVSVCNCMCWARTALLGMHQLNSSTRVAGTRWELQLTPCEKDRVYVVFPGEDCSSTLDPAPL